MVNYGTVTSTVRPKTVEVTDEKVFVHTNIQGIIEVHDEVEVNMFQFEMVEYTKDEYIAEMSANNEMLTACVLEMSEMIYA